MSTRYVIFPIDDFASSRSANEAVVQAFAEGIATSAEIMVPCPWFLDAVTLAKTHHIPVGVHLTFTCEYPNYGFGPLTRNPALTRDGQVFHLSGKGYGPELAEPLYQEGAAQIEHLLSTGLTPTHFDCHMHTVPRWDQAFIEVARRLSRRFSMPFLNLNNIGRTGPGEFALASYTPLSRDNEPDFAAMKTDLRQRLEGLPPGLTWMRCHAARDTFETRALAFDANYVPVRSNELRLLIDADVREWLRELDIEPVRIQEVIRRGWIG